MFSDPIFLSRKLRTKTTVTNYIGAWSDGQRETMIKQSPYLFKMKKIVIAKLLNVTELQNYGNEREAKLQNEEAPMKAGAMS